MEREVPPDDVSCGGGEPKDPKKPDEVLQSSLKPERYPTTFYTLPRELRDKIYGYYFEDDYEDSYEDKDGFLRLTKACEEPHLLPPRNITLVSKQIRDETYEDCKKALSIFWSRYKYRCIIELDASDKKYFSMGEPLNRSPSYSPVRQH